MKTFFSSLLAMLLTALLVAPTHAQEDVSTIVKAIPSPIEVSQLIKSVQKDYNSSLMHNADKASGYSTNFKKALNLGVYSTNLGVANLYEQSQDVLTYLDAVRDLANGLAIGQYFDYETLKKLSQSNDLNKLVELTNQNVEKINDNLSQRGREHLAVLLVTGGWLEATHLMAEIYKVNKSADLRERIGEQKNILDMLLPAVEKYSSKPGFPGLIAQLKALQAKFNAVNIKVIPGEQRMVERNGQLVVEDGSKTVVTISDATMMGIANQLGKIRGSIIKN